MEREQQIILTDEEGEKTTLTVLADTVLQGKTYLLVAEGDDDSEETACDILVRVGEDDEYWSYEFVEDEEELENIFKVFETLLAEEDMEV